MKRFLLALLALSFLFVTTALAARFSAEELQHAVSQEYPDWQIWKIFNYGAGRWEDEIANHCEIGLFRVTDGQLELKELYALLNPLKKGDRIPWEVSDWVKVPLAEDAAQRISGLSSSKIWEDGPGFVFDESILPGSAAFLLDQGMSWDSLAAYPDYLVGVAIHSQGLRSIRVAHWDGEAYAQTTVSPLQQAALAFDSFHSFNDSLVFSADGFGFSLSCDAAGIWRLDVINNGSGVLAVEPHGIIDLTYGGENSQNNHVRHYGKPLFPTRLKELNIAKFPVSVEEALTLLDAEGYACTKSGDAGLYDAPNGKRLAACFSRVVGQVKEALGDWVCLEIGDAAHGLTGWFLRDELAFGKEIETVLCSFPSYGYLENENEYLRKVMPGLRIPLHDYPNAVWLIGQGSDGSWLVEINEQQVLFAPHDAFGDIGPTESPEF